MSTPQIVGVIGSGGIGRDPFDRRAWSGGSRFLFGELRRREALHRAFGVEASRLRRYFCMGRNFHPNRELWRQTFYLDLGYRRALTERIRQKITPGDLACDFLQVGAFYDAHTAAGGRARCFSYHDGSLAVRARGPYFPKAIRPRKVADALAYERDVCHKMTRVFTMSEYLRRSFIDDFSIPAERVIAIGGGINLERIPDPVPGKPYDGQEVLFIGIEFERKGGWQLLEAWQGVRRKRPGAVLHIVGPHRLSLPARWKAGVVVHGYLDKLSPEPAATLEGLFQRCCLFVMPSLYEPFGIAPLEAMAHQLPAVVTDDWALAEMVTPGVHGALTAGGDVGDLERQLTALLGDPEKLRRMGEAARTHVLNHYTWQHVVGRLIEAIAAA
jgi:glycosyltransferase involved in cell wall biosynthesis